MYSEADARMEIDYALINKGWALRGSGKNVYGEYFGKSGFADYILRPNDMQNPLIIIEAKRQNGDLNSALEQGKRYAREHNTPLVFASDGSSIKTFHMKQEKPLFLNGEELDQFINLSTALQYLNTNEYSTLDKLVVNSRKELITVFSGANNDLRKEGLQLGTERFSEFCNILFLKIFSEEEEMREQLEEKPRIRKNLRWDYFRNLDGDTLLDHVNNTVIKHFQDTYGQDIFSPLQIQSAKTLKKMITSLDPLSLIDTKSDIKGDAFEYFFKAYIAKQQKDLGEYFTPRHIVKTLVKLINPKFGETIYDPFCGTGGMLIESFKHIHAKMPLIPKNLKQLQEETIFGSEITKNAFVTKMNMILTGDGHNNIKKQDSLLNPHKDLYDIVITNMPFSLGTYGEEYAKNYSWNSSLQGNANSLCIENCFNAINPRSKNPRIGLIVPDGILFDKNFTKLRENIYKNSQVESIVSLPQGAFKPYADVRASILYLTNIRQNKDIQKSVWYFPVKNDGYTLNTKRKKKEGVNDLDILLSYTGSTDEELLSHLGFSKLKMEEMLDKNYISIPNFYKNFDIKSREKVACLGDLIEELKEKNNQEIYPVFSVSNSKGFVLSDEHFKEQVASDNTSNYKIVPLNAFAYNPARINVGSIAYNEREIGCVSPMYVVWKVRNEQVLLPKYINLLLRSEEMKEQIKYFAYGSVRETLGFDDFCRINIPLPSLEIQRQIIEDLEEIDRSIETANNLIESLKIRGGGVLSTLWTERE